MALCLYLRDDVFLLLLVHSFIYLFIIYCDVVLFCGLRIGQYNRCEIDHMKSLRNKGAN